MEYKILLENWRSHQKFHFTKRLKMANKYPCILHSGRGAIIPEATLSFVTDEEERRMEVRSGQILVIINLQDILGYAPEEDSIVIRQREGKPIITLQFPTPATQQVALGELEIFARESVNLPTALSSTDAGDD